MMHRFALAAAALARAGTPLDDIVTELLELPFFHAEPPKSTGRELFTPDFVDAFIARCLHARPDCSAPDIVATATALTGRSPRNARALTVVVAAQWIGPATAGDADVGTKRVMLGTWSYLRQFMYTKFIIVTDDDVNVRDWKEVIWAMTTRVDPRRDTLIADATPIDYLDFASPVAGLGSKMGIDATNKWPAETARQWGAPIAMDEAVKKRVDEIWRALGL